MGSADGDRPGHPVVRRWLHRHPDAPFRQSASDRAVRGLLARLGLGGVVRDLGGSDNLTVLVDDGRYVLRSYKPFVGAQRVAELQHVRALIVAAGLDTPVPVAVGGGSVHPCGGRWAEIESYRALPRPATPAALFAGLGRLHRALGSLPHPSTTGLRPSFVTVDVLRDWLGLNVADGLIDADRAHELDELLDRIERCWTPPGSLPVQLVHGDPHAGNIRHDGAKSTIGHLYLDFGGIELAPRAHDLAMAITYQVAGRGFRVAHRLADLATWLDAYDQTNPVGVTARERRAIPGYAAAVAASYDICGWGDGWRSHGAELLDLDLAA